MSTIDYLIARGKTLTGRKLRDALHAATGKVVGGRGIIVRTINGHSVVSIKGHTPRGSTKSKTFPALLLEAIDFGQPNRWVYEWAEARLTTLGGWLELEGGRTSVNNVNFQFERNRMELTNTEFIVSGGVVVDLLPGSVTVLSAVAGNTEAMKQVVEMSEIKTDGLNGYWFTFANGVQPGCPLAPEQLPPPPTVELLA